MASRPSSRSDRAPLLRGWALWPQVLVRGAGFSFAWLDEVVTREGTAALREVAADSRFREAVTWQNRAAVADGLDSLLRKSAGASDSRTRKKELLVVRYLQRYCAKNDTIGFFGPVGWARWGRGHFVPSPVLVEARAAFAEPWMARALADAELATPAGLALAWVRVPGHVRIDGRVASSPSRRVALSVSEAALLGQLQRSGPRRWSTLRGSRLLLAQQLVDLGLLRLSIPVSIGARPLSGLGRRAAPWERQVRGLGEPGLAGKLEALERDFTRATAHAPTRHGGRAYGGRGLVYEECRRAVSLELSEAMRAQVAAPLTVVLELARWFTFRVARSLEQLLRGQRGGVPLPVFWQATAPLFAGASPRVLRGASRALRAVCARLWASGPACAVEDAERLVARLDAPHPGWPGARHHAPDLLWAAPSAEAMLRGEGTPVLGELHPAVTPFSTLSVLALAPDRRALERQWARDFPMPLVSPVPWEDFARSSHDARLARRHWHLDLGDEFESDRPADQVLRAADLDVLPARQGYRVVHRRLPLSFSLLEVFERRLKMIAASAFSLGDGAAAGPRRTLGPLVVQRAHWRFPADALGWLEAAEGRRERAAAFRAAHGLPRRVFVRSPTEVKPLYLDFEAPLLLEMIARLARQAPWLSMSEMLPGPDGLWLRDASGAPYVCELRCVAVDPRPHPTQDQ